MTFSEKLDHLMKLTNTTNSALARSVSLDASFISRLRSGQRPPAKNENYLQAIALYFARHCSADHQRAALNEILKIKTDRLPTDLDHTAELIRQWFLEETMGSISTIENFLIGLSQFSFKKPAAAPEIIPSSILDPGDAGSSVFYGTEGKRQAVTAFLTLVLKQKKPQTLLLYSDEDMGWLTENREFTLRWASLLQQVIMGGNRIKIIHTVNRSLDEMLSAIEEWLPIYMTGAIEPYYYPRTRDGVFKRTLFIAPETASVTSSSVRNGAKQSANFLFTDRRTIDSLTREYNDYLSLCRPLMQIFTPASYGRLLAALTEFEDEEANSILKTDNLSVITMPLEVAESMSSRMGNAARNELLAYHERRINSFAHSLKKHRLSNIISLPEAESIQQREVKAAFAGMLGSAELFYTPEEFKQQLQNVITLLQSHDNYDVYLAPVGEAAGYMIYAKEDVGVIVSKTSTPSVVFAINESNLTSAFWDYLSIKTRRGDQGKENRKHTIAMLEEMLERPKVSKD